MIECRRDNIELIFCCQLRRTHLKPLILPLEIGVFFAIATLLTSDELAYAALLFEQYCMAPHASQTECSNSNLGKAEFERITKLLKNEY